VPAPDPAALTQTGDAPLSPAAVLVLIALAIVGVLITVILRGRTKSADVVHSRAGADVRSTSKAERVAERGATVAAPRKRALPQLGAVIREVRLGSKDSRPPVEPRLTRPVIARAPWGSMLVQGSCADDRVVIRAATVRGPAHAFEESPGQDALGLAWNDSRRALIAVVADGLGSLAGSGEVAAHAVRRGLWHGARIQTADELVDVPRKVTQDLERAMAVDKIDGATTIVMSEIRLTSDGAEVSVVGVGDSEAWYLHGDEWTVIHHERRHDGENVTRHLPSREEPQRRRVRVPNGSVVLLASDGFAGALGSGGSPLSSELARRWRRPPILPEFLAQVDFVDRFFTDDRAAVAVWIR
jgi:serine/threonine protein phosphatase PrpC